MSTTLIVTIAHVKGFVELDPANALIEERMKLLFYLGTGLIIY